MTPATPATPERLRFVDLPELHPGSGRASDRLRAGGNLPVEVSGIASATGWAVPQQRLREKGDQVLQRATSGYASVTTFALRVGVEGERVHSFLHGIRRSETAGSSLESMEEGQ